MDIEISATHSRRYALLVVGWLLLAGGMAILALDNVPSPLEPFDIWLQLRLAALHVDAPMGPGVWLPGLLSLLIGMILIAWAGRGSLRLPGAPVFSIQPPPAMARALLSYRRVGLLLLSVLFWELVMFAVITDSTHRAVLPLWLAAITAQAVCWRLADRDREVSFPSARWSRSIWPLLLALSLAFGVTLYRLGDVPNNMWRDERAFWTWARDLAYGLPANPFDLGVYGAFPVTSSLFQSLWIRLFGPTVWSWRLGSVVAGTLTIVPLFFLTRRLLGRRVAWSAVVLMVSMPFFLAYARIGYNSIQPLLPLTAGLWLLVESLRKQSRLLAYLSGVACGMASLTYMNGHIGLILAVLTVLFFFFTRPPLRRSLLPLTACLLMGWLLTAGPLVLGSVLGGKPVAMKVWESFFGSAFYGERVFSADALTRLYPLWRIGPHQIFFEPRLYGLLLGRGLLRTALSLVADGFFTKHYLVGPFAGPGAIFCLAGLAWTLSRCRRWPAALWATWTLSCLLLFSALNTFPPRGAHLTPIIPVLAVLSAIGVWLLSGSLRWVTSARRADWVGVALTVILALLGLRSYFVVMPRRYPPNLEDVIFWRAQEMETGSNLVFVEGDSSPGFSVWGIEHFDLGVTYHSVPAERVQSADFRALCGSDCHVFCLPEDAQVVLERLRAQLGAGAVRAHFGPGGRVVGVEFAPQPAGGNPP
ncbi:MAG TPA: hypothetical protein G4N99_03425 [Thermoflexia bacterium]|nr:hypothetical protein [Thermoflexia bacterium]